MAGYATEDTPPVALQRPKLRAWLVVLQRRRKNPEALGVAMELPITFVEEVEARKAACDGMLWIVENQIHGAMPKGGKREDQSRTLGEWFDILSTLDGKVQINEASSAFLKRIEQSGSILVPTLIA